MERTINLIKKFFCQVASAGLLILMLTSCGNSRESLECGNVSTDAYSSTVFAMDTVMNLTVYGTEAALGKAEDLIVELEHEFSVTDTQSDIYNLNHNGSSVLHSDTYELLNAALELCKRTDGMLDISIYPVVQAWGFTIDDYRVPEKTELEHLLQFVNYETICLDETGNAVLAPGMEVDLGSVAKGYTGKRLVELLLENGVTNAVLNLGGNVQVLGAKPDGTAWRVAITDPLGNGHAGVVEVIDKAIITSGGYERYFEQDGVRYHHIIDPATGYPADSEFLSVTVIGDDGIVCDALSTALFVMGPDRAAEFWNESNDFDAIFITPDGICITEGLKDSFTALGVYKNTKVTVLHHN